MGDDVQALIGEGCPLYRTEVAAGDVESHAVGLTTK
jgi:hypothetical protein